MPTSSQNDDFVPEPNLHPLYPLAADVARLLLVDSGLSPGQKRTLVTHCMTRASIFGDLSFLQYILHDPQAHPFIDLNVQDEDGLVLASVIIWGFGAESDRDVEREECVRLLIAEGADMHIPDKAGWTPLHHAALLAPPTLISHLLTHGCSPLSVTLRNMTALDIVTAYSVIPGREDVALFLEEAMRSEGWQSSKMAIQRRSFDEKVKQIRLMQSQREAVEKILNLDSQWWTHKEHPSSLEIYEDEEVDENECIYTPTLSYASMLVFSPASLPSLLESLITNFRPAVRNAGPANALYMLARFACLTCDHTWLEELIVGATDAVEDVAFTHPDDLMYTVFWLYNCTAWLHLLRCDDAISETCDLLGSFELIEEVINTVYVLIIRVAERHIDKLIDSTLLEHSPLVADLESVQFESEWSLFRSPFSSKKKVSAQTLTPSSTSTSVKSTRPASPVPSASRPSSPIPQQGVFGPQTPKGFSSLRQSFTRARGASSTSSLQGLFADGPAPRHPPQELITFLQALHTLLTDSCINPAIITQLWSQVMYWTSSELFNRIITRKRYLCRSRALQIGMNLSSVEEWIGDVGLPRGVASHFGPARELLLWLQCLSSMDEFSNLIGTIQNMKHLNPLQMRRAVRDYRYEVNETRMSEDCSQYLVQLQKDWERQRVRLGVEALRKEIIDREKDYDDDSLSSETQEANGSSNFDRSFSGSPTDISPQSSIDILFDRTQNALEWIPQRPPEVLGELLESRCMLPLALPTDPRMLAAIPCRASERAPKRTSPQLRVDENARSLSRSSSNSKLGWELKSSRVRHVGTEMLDWLDDAPGLAHWARRTNDDLNERQSDNEQRSNASSPRNESDNDASSKHVRLTRMARGGSSRSRQGRSSTG